MNLFNILRSNKNRLKKGYPYWFWAIDLHDTIFKADYQPGSSGGNYFPGAKEALQLLSKDSSVKIILFSSSIKEAIEEAVTRLQADDIIIDYINENPLVKDNNLFDKKFFMDVILDDKAGFEADYDWFAVMSEYQRSKKEYLNPTPTVDIVCENEKEELLFIQRKNEPIGWALPGGFIDYGEVAEDAARRELQEETGIKVDSKELRLIGVFSDPQRDPRMHTITIAYSCRAIGRAIAGDDANDAVFFSPKSLPTLAFDHGKIIDKYLNSKKLLTGE
jgi:8-oxo-dGTP diphosphatase